MLEKKIEEKIGEAVKADGGLYYKFVSPGNHLIYFERALANH